MMNISMNLFEATAMSVVFYVFYVAGFVAASWVYFSDKRAAEIESEWKYKRNGFLFMFPASMVINWGFFGFVRFQFYQWLLTFALQPWLAATTAFAAMVMANFVVAILIYDQVAVVRGKEVVKILMAESLLKDRPEEIIIVKNLGGRRVVESMKRRKSSAK